MSTLYTLGMAIRAGTQADPKVGVWRQVQSVLVHVTVHCPRLMRGVHILRPELSDKPRAHDCISMVHQQPCTHQSCAMLSMRKHYFYACSYSEIAREYGILRGCRHSALLRVEIRRINHVGALVATARCQQCGSSPTQHVKRLEVA